MSISQKNASAARSRDTSVKEVLTAAQGSVVEVDGPQDKEAQAMAITKIKDTYGPEILVSAAKHAERFFSLQKGVDEANNALIKAQGSQSAEIMAIAHDAQEKSGGHFLLQVSIFKGLCNHAEKTFKDKHQKDLKDLAPGWPVNKSRIIKAMLGGFSARDFDTVNALVTAQAKVIQQENASKGSTDTSITRAAGVVYLGPNEVKMSDLCLQSITVLFRDVMPRLSLEEQDALGVKIGEVAGRFASAANDRIERAAKAAKSTPRQSAVAQASA